LSCGWALEDEAVIVRGLEGLDRIHRTVLASFSQEEIWENSDLSTFLGSSVLSDDALLVEYAQALQGKPHKNRGQRTGEPVSHHLLDAYVAMIVGDEPGAQAAIQSARTALSLPEHPPSRVGPVLDMFDAILTRDQEQLDVASQAQVDNHALAHAPTKDSHSSPMALIDAELTMLARIAAQRGLTVPPSSYLFTEAD